MIYLKNYNNYNEDLMLEKFNIKSLFDEFKSTPNKFLAKIIISSLLSIFTLTQATNIIQTNFNNDDRNILIDSLNRYSDPLSLKLSQTGWNHIRKEEGLKLKAYNLGDNHITIGFGHAQPIKNSKYKVGDNISETEANKLFIKDVNIAAKGVKRIFNQWKKQGIDIKLTQNQYDVLVSMSYNMGIKNLRKTEFIQKLKSNNFIEASELIKYTGISDNYPGLKSRRLKEYQMFIS